MLGATAELTRYFGTETGGAASGPHVWPLSDGAKILLALLQWLTGVNGRTYESGAARARLRRRESIKTGT
ncbi:MAG: hypothetical protein M3Y57_03905 [Acidobacteriota bacterium]|nr:hypothetical protein [Acidobacteriota bacterium]